MYLVVRERWMMNMFVSIKEKIYKEKPERAKGGKGDGWLALVCFLST